MDLRRTLAVSRERGRRENPRRQSQAREGHRRYVPDAVSDLAGCISSARSLTGQRIIAPAMALQPRPRRAFAIAAVVMSTVLVSAAAIGVYMLLERPSYRMLGSLR